MPDDSVIITVLTAGNHVPTWLGEINEYRVGNGISLIIGGIIARIPTAVREFTRR